MAETLSTPSEGEMVPNTTRVLLHGAYSYRSICCLFGLIVLRNAFPRQNSSGRAYLGADDRHRGQESLDLVVADQAALVRVADLVYYGQRHKHLLV